MILKTAVPEPSLPKSGSPTIQKNIVSFKNRSPSTKNGSSGELVRALQQHRSRKNKFLSVNLRKLAYLLVFPYVLVAQKNRLHETVLLSTHNICFG